MDRSSRPIVRQMYDLLYAALGPQHWWPADTREEVIIGAILTQNTSWKNVERAIGSLRQADCLTLRRINSIAADRLAELIRSSGTHRVKADRLKNLTRWLQSRFDGDLDALFALERRAARRELLSVTGIGPETADAILLYAGGVPTFVVDAYTNRILRRHYIISPDGSDYGATQAIFERTLPPDDRLYGEYHALLVETGKRFCRKRAECERCPLVALPHDPSI